MGEIKFFLYLLLCGLVCLAIFAGYFNSSFMKKNILFFKKSLFLTALLCLGIVRSAAQDAAPTVESGWRAELGLFYAGASYEQRVASRFSLVGHFDLHPEWGRMVYGNPNMKFGGLGKQWTAFSYIGLGLPKWKFYRSPIVDGWERGGNWNLVLDLGIGYRL